MNILLMSAYDAESHVRWRTLLVDSFPEYNWTILSLPARYFSWRVRGNSLTWAFSQRDVLIKSYDLVIATSMVDLSSLRGLVPQLCLCPTLVYFHENQFAYPQSGRQFSSLDPQITSLYSALAASKIAFNSDYNRDTFLLGVDALLSKMPDCVPEGIVKKLKSSSVVLPVPIASNCFVLPKTVSAGPLSIVWNHRWEYDKAPERLFAAIKTVLEQGVEIHLHILGQQFRKQPAAFEQMLCFLNQYYPNVLQHWGYVQEVAQYRAILAGADVVLSTALHDFQGLSVLEAVAAGCIPLLPNRLCYGQWFGQEYLYESHIDNSEQEEASVAQRISALALLKQQGSLLPAPDVSTLCVDQLKKAYAQMFAETISQHSQVVSE